MNTVNFVTDDKNETEFVKALKKNVREYFTSNGISTKSNLRMVLKTIVMLSLYIVPFVLLLTVSVPTWMALVLVVMPAVRAFRASSQVTAPTAAATASRPMSI